MNDNENKELLLKILEDNKEELMEEWNNITERWLEISKEMKALRKQIKELKGE